MSRHDPRRFACARLLLCLLVLSLAGEAQESPLELMREADRAFRAGEAERAASLFEQALAKDPSLTPAHMMLGMLRAQQGQWDAAGTHFRAVTVADPSNAHAHFFLGRVLQFQGDWTGAAKAYGAAFENGHPERDKVVLHLAAAEIEAGRPEDAVTHLGALPEPPEESLAALYRGTLGAALADAGRLGEAVAALRGARELDGTNAEYQEQLVEALTHAGETVAALNEAVRAQRWFPLHPGVQYRFGIAGYYIVESPFTKLALRNLREARPDDPRVLVLEGLVHRKQARLDQAKQALSRAAQAGVPEAHLFLGGVLWAQGELAAAKVELLKAEQKLPANGHVFLQLGGVLLALDDPWRALKRLQAAERLMPGHPDLHRALAEVYRRLNQPELADKHQRLFENEEAQRTAR